MVGGTSNILCVLLSTLVYIARTQENGKVYGDQEGVASSPQLVDQSAADSGYGHGGGHKGSDFFMYAHQPSKKEYEFGFKRGNDYHTIERYEKAGPHHNFKTKVRWHDKKGGHGEHYWDYNHAPKYHDDHGHDDHHDDGHNHDDHGDHGGHGHNDHKGHGHDDHGGYHSQPVPDYAPIIAASDRAGAALTKIVSSQSLPTKEDTSTDTYRRRSDKVDQKKDIEISKKDTGLGKKKYRKYRLYKNKVMKVSNSSDTTSKPYEVKSQEEAPSSFPEMLGFSPYQHTVLSQKAYNPSTSHSSVARTQESRIQPPVIAQEGYISSPSYSSTTNKSTSSGPKTNSSPPVPDPRYSTQIRNNNEKPNKNNKGKKNGSFSKYSKYMSRKTYSTYTDLDSEDDALVESPPSDSVSSASSLTEDEASGLAFDLESGRIFNHKTGEWYILVPVKNQ